MEGACERLSSDTVWTPWEVIQRFIWQECSVHKGSGGKGIWEISEGLSVHKVCEGIWALSCMKYKPSEFFYHKSA